MSFLSFRWQYVSKIGNMYPKAKKKKGNCKTERSKLFFTLFTAKQ